MESETRNMTTSNIFEYASRNKIRFNTVRGALTVEQLWDVPLYSKDDFDLNAIAKGISRVIKEASEENFVEVSKTTEVVRLETSLEIVKHVIKVKLAEHKAAQDRAANRQKKEKLLAILAEKQDGALSALSVEELQKQIAELES